MSMTDAISPVLSSGKKGVNCPWMKSKRFSAMKISSSGTAGEEDFEVAVEMDPDTEAMLLEKAAAWLMKAQSQQSH